MKKIIKTLLLAVLLLVPGVHWGQGHLNIDSLQRVIETTKIDTVRGRTLCILCRELTCRAQYAQALELGQRGLQLLQQAGGAPNWEAVCLANLGIIYGEQSQFARALACFERSLALQEKIGNRSAVAHNLNNIGMLYWRQGDFEQALKYYQRGLALSEAIGDRNGIANRLNNIGAIYREQGNYAKALEHFQLSRKYYEELNDRAAVARALNNLSSVYRVQGDFVRAVEYLQQSLEIYEKLENPTGIASCLNNLGNIYTDQHDYPLALDYLQRSLVLWQAVGNQHAEAGCLSEIAGVYGAQHDLAQALTYLQRSLALQEAIGDQAGVAACLTNLGIINLQKGDYPQALGYLRRSLELYRIVGEQSGIVISLAALSTTLLETGQPVQARNYAQQSLNLAQQIGSLIYKKKAAEALYRADSVLGNWKGAFSAHHLYKIYADSLKNDKQSQELGRLLAKAKYEKQAEIERLRAHEEQVRVRQQFNWALGSLGGGLVLAAVIAFILFRGRQKEKRANTALRALNSEIQQQKAEIEAQNSEITAQRDQLNAANERLHELDRMKEQLTGMIVHDLKNPLNAVLAMAALPPDAKRINVIREAGQQMSQLVLNLLDVQKYEEAALVLKPELISAVELIRRATSQTDFLAHQKQIAFDVRADVRLLVEADVELIVRVLVNLLTNAIKYAPAGDRIEIEAQFDEGRGAVFRVTDHGQGIPSDQLERIFEKFGQVGGGEASGQLRSTGLGLTFCRLTVEAHGGRIDVRSAVGRYTTFEFNLPQAKQTEAGESTVTEGLSTPAQPAELSAAYRAAHAGVLGALADLPLYSISDLADALEGLPETEAGVAAWKDAVMAAALAGNAAAYRALVEGSVPEGDS